MDGVHYSAPVGRTGSRMSPIFLPPTDWILTRFGPVRVCFDERRDAWELWYGNTMQGEFFGYLTEEERYRLRTSELVLMRIQKLLEIYLKSKEGASHGENRRENAQGHTQGGGETPGAKGAGTDPATDTAEGSAEGPGEDLEPPLAGWRGWRLQGVYPTAAAYHDEFWHWTKVNYAKCKKFTGWSSRDFWGPGGREDEPHHPAPAEGCQCGFWSYRTKEEMDRDAPRNLDVYGVVSLGGDLEEHKFGVKAAEARIIALLDSPRARQLKEAWESGAIVDADGNMSWNWRSSDTVFGIWDNYGYVRRTAPDETGKGRGVFPVPILSELECEMLAIEQGCVFESEPRRPDVPVYFPVGQYLVFGGGKDMRYQNGIDVPDVPEASVVFAPEGEKPYGALRIDGLVVPDQRVGSRCTVSFGGKRVDMVWTKIGRADGPDMGMWCVAGQLNDRDFALQEAINKYGRAWLSGYAL